MALELTQHDINEKKWRDLWESIVSHMKRKIDISIVIIDNHSVGIHHNGKCYQLRGTDKTFKFDNNKSISVKASSLKTGKFLKVFEYNISEKSLMKYHQAAHKIYGSYTLEDLEFLESLRDVVISFFKPTSIKFIMDDL